MIINLPNLLLVH